MTDDTISRQAAIEILATMQGRCTTKAALLHNSKIWKQIKDLPTAEPQIIRCKDCLHWKHFAAREHYCEVFDWTNTDEDYCSFAERLQDSNMEDDLK